MIVETRRRFFALAQVVILALASSLVGGVHFTAVSADGPAQTAKVDVAVAVDGQGKINLNPTEICVGDRLTIRVGVAGHVILPDGSELTIFASTVKVSPAQYGVVFPLEAKSGIFKRTPEGLVTNAAMFNYRATDPGQETLSFTATLPRNLTPPGPPVVGSTTLQFTVKECPVRVSLILEGRGSASGTTISDTGFMDEVTLAASGDNEYSGSGEFTLAREVSMPICTAEISTQPSQADLSVVADEQGELSLSVTFQPMVEVTTFTCPAESGSRSDSIDLSSLLDISSAAVPASGGVVRKSISDPFWYGTLFAVVTRDEEPAVVSAVGRALAPAP